MVILGAKLGVRGANNVNVNQKKMVNSGGLAMGKISSIFNIYCNRRKVLFIFHPKLVGIN